MILTDGPKAIPFAPLPLEWLEPEMLKAIPASPAHLWTYLWSLTEHKTGCLPKGVIYTHLAAARKLRIDERTVRRWFVTIEGAGWMESVRVRSGLRFRLRRVPPPDQPTGADRTQMSVSSNELPDRDRTQMSVSTPERTSVSAAAVPDRTQMSAETGTGVRGNGHQSPFPMDPERIRDSEGGGGPAAAVVPGGQDSTPLGPPLVDRPPPVTPPTSKSVAGPGRADDALRATDRVTSELREYLGGVSLDPGVRRTIADAMGGRPLAAQREIVLTAAASFKQEGFKYVGVPQIWHDRLVEATGKVESRLRQREAALFKGYDPNDPRYPAPTQSEKEREEARALLYRRAPTMLGEWDPVTRRTVPVPVSLRPVSDSFATIKDTIGALPQLRPPAPPTEGDAA